MDTLELFLNEQLPLETIMTVARVEEISRLPDHTVVLRDTAARLAEIDDALDVVVGPCKWRYTTADGQVELGDDRSILSRLLGLFP